MSKPFFPAHMQKSRMDELIRCSKDRSSKLSKYKAKQKWKASPYKKKLAVQLQKLKTVIHDTPEKLRHSTIGKRKRNKISEYSNFIHVPNKHNSGKKFAKRKFSKD